MSSLIIGTAMAIVLHQVISIPPSIQNFPIYSGPSLLFLIVLPLCLRGVIERALLGAETQDKRERVALNDSLKKKRGSYSEYGVFQLPHSEGEFL